MRRGKSILVIVSGILIGLGIAALGLRLYLGRAAEDLSMLWGVVEVQPAAGSDLTFV